MTAAMRRTPGWDLALAVVFAALTETEIWVVRSNVAPTAQVAGAMLVAVMAVTLAFRSTARRRRPCTASCRRH